MPNTLADNIRELRRSRGFTQEQLAETLGVSAGAVSKWENGASNPELPMLMSLADCFEVSTDALLGYESGAHVPQDTADVIKHLTVEKRIDEAVAAADVGLKRYPNSFDVVYHSAKAYNMAGFEHSDATLLRRAQELYERAGGLISQNTDPEICYEALQMHIGILYASMGENDKAVEQLSKHNPLGINSAHIGRILTSQGKYEDALALLSDNLIRSITNLYTGTIGMISCYAELGEDDVATGIAEWTADMLAGISREEGSYIDKLRVPLYTACAMLNYRDEARAKSYLLKAKQLAQHFDSAPAFGTSSVKYFRGENHAFYDDLGQSAHNGITETINSQTDEKLKSEILRMWRELNEN